MNFKIGNLYKMTQKNIIEMKRKERIKLLPEIMLRD